MRKIIFGLLVCSHFFCFAQDKTVLDSLNTIYKTTPHDSTRINALIGIAKEYSNSDPDTAISIANQAFKKSENLARVEKEKAKIYNIIGFSYFRKDNYLLALDYSQKALKYAEKTIERREEAFALNTIAGVYYRQKNYTKSLEYLQKSIKIYELLNNTKSTIKNMGNVAMVYEAQNNIPLALEYYEKSLAMARKYNSEPQIAYTLSNMGGFYLKLRKYDEATKCLEESLEYEKKIHDEFLKANTYIFLSKVHKEQNRYKECEKYALEGLKAAQNVNSLNLINKSGEILYNIYKETGDYKKSLEYLEIVYKTQDSLTNVEKTKALANLETKVALEHQKTELEILKKNKEILEKEQNLQNTINYFVVAAFLIGMGMMVYIYRNWLKEKNSKKQIAHQKEEIEAINESLESLVHQRTQSLAERNKQLEEYAFYNAHKLRAPVATIMGLYFLLEKESDYEHKNQIFNHLHKAIEDLDHIVSEIQEIVAEQN